MASDTPFTGAGAGPRFARGMGGRRLARGLSSGQGVVLVLVYSYPRTRHVYVYT
jgi:hypothetical protein